ncbi:PilN domain-containing protein [Myxococcota bacterium]|nr:PilN domain-containing protein [Myxococcota bacterium]MBU1537434.1 PilN domain-containing protein [Myxococcota bacterium]
MIRINLVSQKVTPNQKKGQQNLLIGVIMVILTAGGCFYHYTYMLDRSVIEKNRKIANQYMSQLGVLQRKLAKIKVVPAAEKKKLQDQYTKKYTTVTRIEKIRSNPVFALLEVSRILSQGQFPTIEKANAKARLELDINWDPSQVFLSKISEVGREVELWGKAKSHYDISELTKRLRASAYFRKPEIVESKVFEDRDKTGPSEIQFKIRAIMVY